MYKATYYDKANKLLHIWDDKTGYEAVRPARYGYVRDRNGPHTTIYGDRVSLTSKPWDVTNADDLFESDIPPLTRYLVDRYYKEDSISDIKKFFFDIEVSTVGGYPNIDEADKEITSIAFEVDGVSGVFVLDPESRHESGNGVYTFSDERSMLEKFGEVMVTSSASILSGWNVDFFDIPYLVHRCERLFGHASFLSPIRIIDKSQTKQGTVAKIAGFHSLDYLILYKKFTYSELPNYRLDTVAKMELGRGKVEYEGDLDSLYQNDLAKFIEYNLEDVMLVRDLDEKLSLIDLARSICHKGNVGYDEIHFTTRYLEGAALTFCKRHNLIVPNKPRRHGENEDPFEGAYVKDPIPGRYEDVFDLDLTSLYPSIIMTLNISPETLIGIDADGDYYRASNGACYTKDKEGIIPQILATWFDERVTYKNLMKQAYAEGDLEKSKFYDGRQMAVKILLNSFYGALGTSSFRFYNRANAEAVTLSGQTVIKSAGLFANKWFTKRTGIVDTINPIYTDTDSIFCTAKTLVDLEHPGVTGAERLQKVNDVAIACQSFVNKAFDVLSEKTFNCPADRHRFEIKCEYVSSAAFWVTKKRYAQAVKLQEGQAKEKLDIKGLEVVRSNFPAAFKVLLKDILQNILDGESELFISDKIRKFKKSIKHLPYQDLMFAGGANSDKYDDSDLRLGDHAKGTPAHVKALQNYNGMLAKLDKDKQYEPIKSGGKILWTYIGQNPYFFETIALKGFEDHPRIEDFVEKHIDRMKQFDSAFGNKIQTYYDAMGWGQFTVTDPKVTDELFDIF